MMIRPKINILGTKAGVRMWCPGMYVCVRKFCKTELKRERGAVIYVREIENNAGGRRQRRSTCYVRCS